MTETIVFADIVAVVLDYLRAGFVALGDSETVLGSRVPTAGRSLTVRLVDSEIRSLVIQKSTLRVECRDNDPLGQQRTHDMAQRARALLGALRGNVQAGVTIYQVTDLGVPGLDDDPDALSGVPRFVFDVSVSHRGTAVELESLLTDEAGDPIVVV